MRGLLELYRDRGVLDQDVDAALDVMREWYNGYRFAEEAEGDLYNTDMVLYYLCESIPNQSLPRDLIDTNVRIDYGKLRHLLVVGRQLNGNFELLRHVIGEGRVDAQVQPSFPLERLDERENFLSLLYFFGLLSFRHVSGDTPRLGIPNQTVRRLMYGYLRDGWRDVDVFSVDAYDFSRLVRAMAYEGAWRPALEHLRDAVRRQTGIRDYVDGEKVVHAFLAAHFSLLDVFLIHTEHELNKGYADLYLKPFVARYPGAAFGYVMEVKYLKRREAPDESVVAEKMREAADQVRRYLKDENLRRRHPSVRHIGLAVVWRRARRWAAARSASRGAHEHTRAARLPSGAGDGPQPADRASPRPERPSRRPDPPGRDPVDGPEAGVGAAGRSAPATCRGIPRPGRLRSRAPHRSGRLAALRRGRHARRARAARGPPPDHLSAGRCAPGPPRRRGVPGRAEAAGGAALPRRAVAPPERWRLDRERLPDVAEDARTGSGGRSGYGGGAVARAGRGGADAGGAARRTPPGGGGLHRLLAGDVIRDILRWMAIPARRGTDWATTAGTRSALSAGTS